jgi:hypothetical protein
VGEGTAEEWDAMITWLRDPGHAEPCCTFPCNPEQGDDFANDLIAGSLGSAVGPLYVDQAGANSRRVGRASGATLNSQIVRHHLRGSTRASSLRRSFAALLWNELELRCGSPPGLEPASNQRLSDWMFEHLQVATVPVDDRVKLGVLGPYVIDALDPALNLGRRLWNSPGRKRLRALRRRHLSVSSADADRIERLLKLHAAAKAGGEGSDFLTRRLEHEQRRIAGQWGSAAARP